MPRAQRKLVHRVGAKARPGAAASRILALALEMEEPLRHATWFVRALEQVGAQGDLEIEALSFVATEARVKLETVHDIWNDIVARIKAI
jgi:hypothetical protein